MNDSVLNSFLVRFNWRECGAERKCISPRQSLQQGRLTLCSTTFYVVKRDLSFDRSHRRKMANITHLYIPPPLGFFDLSECLRKQIIVWLLTEARRIKRDWKPEACTVAVRVPFEVFFHIVKCMKKADDVNETSLWCLAGRRCQCSVG